jgi:hypothetical protein
MKTIGNGQDLLICFDIAVQNGGFDQTEGERIRNKVTQTAPERPQALRKIIANVVARMVTPHISKA